MAEPLSVAASIVGVTVPALHGTRLLLDDLQGIIDAPKSVESLKEDLRSVDLALKSLQAVHDSEWKSLGGTVSDESKVVISSCTRACDTFRADLQHWTRHSEEGKLSWQDRANVGFFKQRQIKSTSEQLQACKLTINSVVGIATLYSSIRHTHITEEIKKTISVKEAEITGTIAATNKRLTEVESTLGQLRLIDVGQDGVQNAEDKDKALKRIKEEQIALDSSRILLQELLLKAREEVVLRAASESQNRSTQITFGNQNAGLQIGISNGPINGISFGGKGA
jgi:hypothetical protein